jgi:hypothetical protein
MSLVERAEKARRELGWIPRPMADALCELLAAELRVLSKKLPPQLEGVRAPRRVLGPRRRSLRTSIDSPSTRSRSS